MAHQDEPNETLELTTSAASEIPGLAAPDRTTDFSIDGSPTRPTPGVHMRQGSGGGFSFETASLLRSRLAGYAIITFGVLAIGYVVSIVSPQPLFLYRTLILLIMLGAYVLLQSDREIPLSKLRVIEAVCVLALLSQVLAMSWLRIESYVHVGDLPSTVAASQGLYTLICLVILAYGTIIPNTWKRAASVLVPLALLPTGWLAIMEATSPDFALMVSQYEISKPIPETLVAAGIAIFASHIIQGARREAFQAKRLGQYVLRDRIGSGGMGEVYRAEHRMLKRPCAIKLIRPTSATSAEAIDRFELEVRATAKLSHWNSVEVYDYGRTDDDTFYYVMELLPGLNLDQIVTRHGSMPPSRAVHFLIQICSALEEAHGQGLIHRDIKPANVFAAHRGGVADVAKLLDFGLVRHSGDESGPSGSFSGTPQYMSPEQAVNYEQVDARADLYSVGAVAYFLLNGQAPFAGKVRELLRMHATATPKSLNDHDASIPEELDQIILRCLQKRPEDRYASATELRQALVTCPGVPEWTIEDARQWWEANPTGDTTSDQLTMSLDRVTVVS